METILDTAAPLIGRIERQLTEELRDAGSFEMARRLTVPTAELETSLSESVFQVHLLGRAQVWGSVAGEDRRAGAMLGKIVGAEAVDPLPFEEAIAFFRSKTNLSPADFYALSEAARTKAFSVVVGVEETIIAAIRDLIESALAEGLTLREFQTNAATVLDRAGVSARNAWYWETVYRTNLQTSYQVGRWKQMAHPDVAARRPYLRYVSARIPTSRPSHVEKHGLIYPQDHPFWETFFPPNGFNCLCSTSSVSESLLKRRGWTVSDDTSFQYPEPDDGWAYNPGHVEAI